MPNRFRKIFVVIAACLGYHIFFMPSTATADISATNTASTKSKQPLYVYLPERSPAFFQKPERVGSLFVNEQKNISSSHIGANQTRSDLSSSSPPFYLGQEVRPVSSLALGFLPAKGAVNVPSPYQYATMETDAKDCRIADKPPRTAAETADNGNSNKGIRLPIGWSVEMCLHF